MSHTAHSAILAMVLTAFSSLGAQTLTVDSIIPSTVSADGSTAITIAGTGFTVGAMAVFVGTQRLVDLVVHDANTITGRAPALAEPDREPGPRPVRLINGSTLTDLTLPEGVIYTVPLDIQMIAPAEVSYLGKSAVAIDRHGFTAATVVHIDGVALAAESVQVLSSRRLQLVAPPHPAAEEPVAVRIVDPVGGEATLASGLRFIGPLTIDGMKPSKQTVGEPGTVTLTGVGFTPETSVEIGGVRVTPAEEQLFVDPRALRFVAPDLAAGEYDVTVIDSDGASEVRAVLAAGVTYVAYTVGEPSFRLSFDAPRSAGGEKVVGVLLEELRNVAPGTSGYSLSIASAGECLLARGTTAGTVGARVEEGGLFENGFQLTRLSTDPSQAGLVHATVFSLGQTVVLEAGAEPHRLLNLHVRPEPSGCGSCRLELRDGLPGPGGPVDNAITYREGTYKPELLSGLDIQCADVRKPGDGNNDGRLDISDSLALLGSLFLDLLPRFPCGDGFAGHPSNRALMDANGDGAVDISDVVSILNFLFLGGPAHALGTACIELPDCPPAPFCDE